MSATTAARRSSLTTLRTRPASVLGGVAVAVVGTSLILAAFVLVVLVARAGISGSGYPETGAGLIRLGAASFMLPLGALMLARLPRHPIGWILCAAAIGSALAAGGAEYATYSHFVDPLPAAPWVGWVSEWAATPSLLVAGVALLLFPTGTLPSRRWRPFLWCGLAGAPLVALNGALGPGEDLAFQGNPFLSDEVARNLGEPFGVGWFLALIATVAGIAAIVVRRRTADGEVREQLRVLLAASVVLIIGFVACFIASFMSPQAFDVGAGAAVGSLAALSAMMAVAILRHRLYGLDVYVNRAMVLTGVTVVLGGLYVGAVLVVGRLLGQQVQLGVALPATALVAVAFHPVRDQLQRRVNRLLHGQRDEPYAAISTLGRRLGEAMVPADVLPVMVDTIADSLRLPYVAVELADDSPGAPAAEHGQPAAGIALRVPLVHAGERVGTLVIGARAHGERLGEADRRLLEDFAHRASAAASAVALSLEVQRSREQLVVAREEERRRLRGDLHDGLGPTLAGAVLTIDAARRMLSVDPHAADTLLDQAAASVEGTVADVRRLVYGLRPPALDQLGIVGALRQQATTLSLGTTPLSCQIIAPDPMPGLPAAVEVAAFRIAQEALTNIARHAEASHASVSIAIDGTLDLEVGDDGRGIAPGTLPGVGLTSMRERATELGGRFEVAGRPGGGTLVRVQLPMTSPVADRPATR